MIEAFLNFLRKLYFKSLPSNEFKKKYPKLSNIRKKIYSILFNIHWKLFHSLVIRFLRDFKKIRYGFYHIEFNFYSDGCCKYIFRKFGKRIHELSVYIRNLHDNERGIISHTHTSENEMNGKSTNEIFWWILQPKFGIEIRNELVPWTLYKEYLLSKNRYKKLKRKEFNNISSKIIELGGKYFKY